MKENPLNNKSYIKSKENRMKFRHEIFEKNRISSTLSYLDSYQEQIRQQIKKSLEGPIPVSLPASCYAVRSTISYYRRNNQPVFKTRLETGGPLDPHMTYQSLLSFLSLQQNQIPNFEAVSQQFQKDLTLYLKMPYQQIREAAAMAAGNHILGKQPEILQIVKQNDNHLWVMINHIYQRNVSSKHLRPFILNNNEKAYRTIFQLCNNKKDQIIYQIISDEKLVTAIMNNLQSQNVELQQYSIRIVGNILAEAEDYASQLTKYHLLESIFPLLNNKSETIRRDGCWLLANYAFQPAAANQMLWKQNLIQRLLIMSRKQTNLRVKTQIYYIFTHLIKLGDKNTTYKMALQQNFLQQCLFDLEIQDQTLNQIILSFIYELINLGDQFIGFQEEDMGVEDNCNPFEQEIKTNGLKSIICGKTFSENNTIRQLSSQILDKISKNDAYFGMI